MKVLLLWLCCLTTLVVTQDSLTIEAELEPLNKTHLKASVQNSYSQPIHILGWNNHFQSSQNGAHGSFKVSSIHNNGTKQAIQPAPNRPSFEFSKPTSSHFTTISSKGWHSSIFDITELFQIPHTGEYNVSMEFSTRVILETGNHSKTEKIATAGRGAENLSKLIIKSQPKTMLLNASISQNTLRRRSDLGPCSDNPKFKPIVLRARENARDLAKYAQNVRHLTGSTLSMTMRMLISSSPTTRLFGLSISTIPLLNYE